MPTAGVGSRPEKGRSRVPHRRRGDWSADARVERVLHRRRVGRGGDGSGDGSGDGVGMGDDGAAVPQDVLLAPAGRTMKTYISSHHRVALHPRHSSLILRFSLRCRTRRQLCGGDRPLLPVPPANVRDGEGVAGAVARVGAGDRRVTDRADVVHCRVAAAGAGGGSAAGALGGGGGSAGERRGLR